MLNAVFYVVIVMCIPHNNYNIKDSF